MVPKSKRDRGLDQHCGILTVSHSIIAATLRLLHRSQKTFPREQFVEHPVAFCD